MGMKSTAVNLWRHMFRDAVVVTSALAIGALSLSGCGAVASPASPGDHAAPSSADARQFHQIVRELSAPTMEGRGAGTAGLDKARDYLVAQFRAAGLAPAFIHQGEPSYTQPFEIRLPVQAVHQSLVLFRPPPAEPVTPEAGQSFNALGFSEDASFEGGAVFVGYGTVSPEHDYDSYRDVPPNVLRGKVAVAFRYEPQDEHGKSLWADDHAALGRWTDAASLLEKAKWAAQHGAVALLVVNPPLQDRGDLKTTSGSAADERAPIPVMHIRASLFDEMLRIAGHDPATVVPVYQRQANHGTGGVTALGGVVVRGRVELEHPTAMIANVAGVLPGRGDLADEVVVVGAHYDHLGYGEVGSLSEVRAVHPGADDNASGVAALILLAKQVKQWIEYPPILRSPGSRRVQRKLIVVTFTGEERGLLGSSHFMKNLDDLGLSTEQINAMVNFDMVGRMKDDILYVMGTATSDRWRDMLDHAVHAVTLQGHKLTLKTNPESFGGSDHMSFVAREVPALHFFTGSHSDYHRVTDTADKINILGALKVVDMTTTLVWQQMGDHLPFDFVPSSAMTMHATAGGHGAGGAYLGVVPDYASLDGDGGCVLSGVAPGGPAHAAGLRGGDVIIRWDQKPVGNVRGLTRRLRDSRSGDEVVVTVRRDGEVIEIHVTLGQRSS